MNISSLNLSATQMEQQVDLSRRLLHMSMLGVPRQHASDRCNDELLALHALITAYAALAKGSPATTQEAAKLALSVSNALLSEGQQQASGKQPPLLRVL